MATQMIQLGAKSTLLVGRAPECDLVLSHPQVSRHHARVWRDGRGAYVQDLGSTNGTYVNGRPVQGVVALGPEDHVQIAGFRFVLRDGLLQTFDEVGNLRLEAVRLSRVTAPGQTILDDVSLAIQPREFVAIVGASGAGKSTLLNALTGFVPADYGSVLYNGLDLYDHFEAYRSSIGYVPQDDIIHRELSLYEALDFAARLRLPPDTASEERHRRIGEVLEELGLAERWQQPIHSLSGGQRKRASIAVELLTKPGLFFLDEPTSGLDPATERRTMQLLRQLADRGRTVVLVTHVTQNVMLCDQTVVLAPGGRLAYFGPPREALGYFGVQDFTDIYEQLETHPAEGWQQAYLRSPQHRALVLGRIQAGQEAGARQRSASPPRPSGPSAARQVLILAERYLRVLLSDRKNTVVLLLQAPLAALILAGSIGRHVFDATPAEPITAGISIPVPPLGDARLATALVMFVALLAIWMPLNIAVRALVREMPIFLRERLVGVRVVPYLLSKLVILLGLSFVQVLMALVATMAVVRFPPLDGVGTLQMLGILSLAGVCGTSLGLAVSTLLQSEEAGASLVPLILLPQIVLAGVIVPLKDAGPAIELLSALMPLRWAYQALATHLDLLQIFTSQGGVMYYFADIYEVSLTADVGFSLAVVGGMTALFLAGTLAALWQRRPL